MSNKVVTFGEIMLRLSPTGYKRFGQADTFEVNFGGGEANVAVSLANYNIPVAFVSRIPTNDLGESCIRQLKGFGVNTTHLLRGGERIGIYFAEKGAVARPSKVIYDRAYSAFSELKPDMLDWNEILKDAGWFHWSGITPAVSESTAQTCLEAIRTANRLGVTVSCDLNYRKKLWKWGKQAIEVMPELVAGCDLVMGNEEDAQMCLGIKPGNSNVEKGQIDPDDYSLVSQKIMEQFPRVKKVITTLRESVSANHNNWSGVIWNGSQLIKSKTYAITHIVDRVGGGDSFMGGLIYGMLHFGDDKKALDFAMAASALKHTIEGDFNRVTVEEVMSLVGGNVSGRVVR